MKRLRLIAAAILAHLSLAFALADIEQADPERFAELIAAEGTLLIDVRTPEEAAAAKIEGAKLINFYDPSFTEELQKLPKDKTLLLYCRSGNRSGQALAKLEALGYDRLVNLSGGIKAWQQASMPTVSQPKVEANEH